MKVLTPAVLLMLGLGACLTPAAGSQSLPQKGAPRGASADSLRAAIQLIQQERYKEAEGKLLEAVKLDPSSAQVYFYLGVATQKLGRPAEAEKYFRRSLELGPRAVNTLYNLGVLAARGRETRGSSRLSRKGEPGRPSQP